ncbi:MAG: hypothetical protein U0798_18625 [Gemmataceae bacterium]
MKKRFSRTQKNRLLLEKLDDRINPVRIEVTNLDDSGMGSLRQAILDANVDPGQDTIVFTGDAAGGTVSLTSKGGTNYGPNAFEITSQIIIQGSGSMAETLEIASTSDTTMRHFYVAPSGTLGLDHIQLTGGIAQGGDGGDGWNGGGGGAGMGGAIFNQGTVVLFNSTLYGNQAFGGNGGGLSGGVGGGGGGGMFGDGGNSFQTGGGGGGYFGNGGAGNSASAGGGGGTNANGENGANGGLGGSVNGGNGGTTTTANGQPGGIGGGGGGGAENESGGNGGTGGGGGGGGYGNGGNSGFGGGGGGGGATSNNTGGNGGFGGGGGGGDSAGGVGGFGGGSALYSAAAVSPASAARFSMTREWCLSPTVRFREIPPKVGMQEAEVPRQVKALAERCSITVVTSRLLTVP